MNTLEDLIYTAILNSNERILFNIERISIDRSESSAAFNVKSYLFDDSVVIVPFEGFKGKFKSGDELNNLMGPLVRNLSEQIMTNAFEREVLESENE